jgi:uncharacterized protein RhaS with RHS repeats
MSARYYNPTLGRFISPDPVHFVEGNIHSFNRYAYANNNPMRYIDPTGESPEVAVEAISISVGLSSAFDNFKGGNIVAGIVDVVGVVVDTVLVAVPAVPGAVGLGIQAARGATKADTVVAAEKANSKVFSKEKQDLVEMAKQDKKTGVTRDDMKAYQDLNKQLDDPFPSNQVRTDKGHPGRGLHSQQPHGHVGPVGHIPIK